MALINCKECQKEISDKVKACPHCGYPYDTNSTNNTQKVEVTGINIISFKVKPIIITLCLVLAGITVIYFIVQNVIKNNYIENLKTIHSKMLDTGADAERLSRLS